MANKYLTDPIQCYLKPEAKLQLDALLAQGFDKDLAMALIEANFSDQDIYELEEGE